MPWQKWGFLLQKYLESNRTGIYTNTSSNVNIAIKISGCLWRLTFIYFQIIKTKAQRFLMTGNIFLNHKGESEEVRRLERYKLSKNGVNFLIAVSIG